MARANFSEATKEIIAKRSAYRCCFPDCDATLIGPGMDSDSIENVGECAHIYAASGKGPRSQHNLTNADFPLSHHLYMATDNQGLTKGFQFFPQHFHNILACWKAGGNNAPRRMS